MVTSNCLLCQGRIKHTIHQLNFMRDSAQALKIPLFLGCQGCINSTSRKYSTVVKFLFVPFCFLLGWFIGSIIFH